MKQLERLDKQHAFVLNIASLVVLAFLAMHIFGCVSGRSAFERIATNYRRVLADHERYLDQDETLSAESKAIRKAHARAILELAEEGAK